MASRAHVIPFEHGGTDRRDGSEARPPGRDLYPVPAEGQVKVGAPTASGLIEIGVCSDMGGTALAGVDGLAELRSVTEPRPFREVCRRFFGHLARLMEEHDADAPIQFVEIGPPEARAEEFAEIAAGHGMPLKQFTRLCVLGGDDESPDAVEALSGYLTLAKRAGTVDRLNIQVLGDSTTPRSMRCAASA